MPAMNGKLVETRYQPTVVRSFGLTDAGRQRPANEDRLLITDLSTAIGATRHEESGHLFLVADGMGGHAGGEQASELAVATIQQFMRDGLRWAFHPDAADMQRMVAAMQDSLRQADTRIMQEQADAPELQGMGTTLTLALQLDWRLGVLHVGDSRAYLYRDGSLRQITRDHTLTAGLVEQGILTPEEAATHPMRNIITNAVGGSEAGIHVESHCVDLLPGDRVLLCSDGLTDMVSDEQIASALGDFDDPELACRRLVDDANEAGGRDNITAIVAAF